jgi:hypothetical protein
MSRAPLLRVDPEERILAPGMAKLEKLSDRERKLLIDAVRALMSKADAEMVAVAMGEEKHEAVEKLARAKNPLPTATMETVEQKDNAGEGQNNLSTTARHVGQPAVVELFSGAACGGLAAGAVIGSFFASPATFIGAAIGAVAALFLAAAAMRTSTPAT